ncbi:hypothetical protein B0H11DRAFT_1915943 [Mycena galericulata]|nr:hypothetical protein B0H11DRAFT_1915943 [Mycena galericulata]
MYTVPAAETVRIAEGTRRATLNEIDDAQSLRGGQEKRLVRLSRAKKTQDARSMHTNAHYLAGALRDIVHTREVNEGRPAHCMRQRVPNVSHLKCEHGTKKAGGTHRVDESGTTVSRRRRYRGGRRRGGCATLRRAGGQLRRWGAWWRGRGGRRRAGAGGDVEEMVVYGSTNVLKIESQDVKSSKDNLNLEFWKRERINSDLSLTMSSRREHIRAHGILTGSDCRGGVGNIRSALSAVHTSLASHHSVLGISIHCSVSSELMQVDVAPAGLARIKELWFEDGGIIV